MSTFNFCYPLHVYIYFCFQSAYLVGISDPSSTAGRPGLVDQSQFARAFQAIESACQNLLNPDSSQQQVSQSNNVLSNQVRCLIVFSRFLCM